MKPASQVLELGGYGPAVDERLDRWDGEEFGRRLWAKDPTLWFEEPRPEITDRLGWLGLPETMRSELPDLVEFSDQVRGEGIEQVVLLGMGGSSLAPEVFQRTFGNAPGHPQLRVLDSTHPRAVLAAREAIYPTRTLFVVSSKSGSTLETLSGFRFFWQEAGARSAAPGDHFVAITDPGSSLEGLAHDRGFRRVFLAPSDVGGRYSALTVFGLVPAALIGVDVERLLERAAGMAAACDPAGPGAGNPALTLGAALGVLALSGRDKVTYVVPPSLAAFPDWLEQLVAESTGKDGTGIVPVAGEALGRPEEYGADRFFVHFTLGQDPERERALIALERAGHPVATIRLADPYDLPAEMFRAELATAAAGAVLGIHPFDQPDVQLAKALATEAMEAGGPGLTGPDEVVAADAEALSHALQSWLGTAGPGDYLAIQAYLPATAAIDEVLQAVRGHLRGRYHLATTLGYGPRFLHSTGQLHKGGPDTGVFLQLVDEPSDRLAVPETDFTFDDLVRAQAVGDYRAMQQRGRRVIRVNLGADPIAGLESLQAAFGG